MTHYSIPFSLLTSLFDERDCRKKIDQGGEEVKTVGSSCKQMYALTGFATFINLSVKKRLGFFSKFAFSKM